MEIWSREESDLHSIDSSGGDDVPEVSSTTKGSILIKNLISDNAPAGFANLNTSDDGAILTIG
jgi:hypothetical protein